MTTHNHQKKTAILVLNTGSSTIKVSLFAYHDKIIEKKALLQGHIDQILTNPLSEFCDNHHNVLSSKRYVIPPSDNRQSVLEAVLYQCWDELNPLLADYTISAVGHRIVHGGNEFSHATIANKQVIDTLTHYIPLAKLHQPFNLSGIKSAKAHYPDSVHVCTFDTAFHHSHTNITKTYALPQGLSRLPIKRYGFHGLSYDYITTVLPLYVDNFTSETKCIIAHLGNGSSLCATQGSKSIATSMGLTALDGVPMGTRCGNLDPGVILYLQQHCDFTIGEVSDLLYHQSGLLGLSGESADMRDLLNSQSPNAQFAIDVFCHRVICEIGSLATQSGGIDQLIFTGGIGQHAALIRKKIIEPLHWLGFQLDLAANDDNKTAIHDSSSQHGIWVIPTNEEWIIAKQTLGCLHA